MDNTRMVKVSKYLSKHLRHQPERLGLVLEPGGWVRVDELLAACRAHNFPVKRAELDEVVARNDKQRFSFDASREMIRANQGHTIEVDLQLEAKAPPPLLYHGTGSRSVESILKDGLSKMARHHVHLSRDVETAARVGARHGRPTVFEVNAAAMHGDGHEFYVSANGVWLVESVPPKYLRKM
ncbi:MAG TPA: RNA 2'-phosphotransferase [Pyrinomonadaceae bacterium]|jgi:putative RNA 2'-phosphotransferase